MRNKNINIIHTSPGVSCMLNKRKTTGLTDGFLLAK